MNLSKINKIRNIKPQTGVRQQVVALKKPDPHMDKLEREFEAKYSQLEWSDESSKELSSILFSGEPSLSEQSERIILSDDSSSYQFRSISTDADSVFLNNMLAGREMSLFRPMRLPADLHTTKLHDFI